MIAVPHSGGREFASRAKVYSKLRRQSTEFRELSNRTHRLQTLPTLVETAHHLFVDCPAFDHLRTSATTEVLRDTSKQLRAAETTPPQTEAVLRFTSALFSDSTEVWPQYSSAYYLGTMPSLPQSLFPANLPSQRLLTRVMQSWHLASIHLTSRIWSAYKRQFFPTASQYTKSPIILPPHLFHLLLP
ncbi:hypothetical protein NUW54_g165 [Trametes sanguinea]|uniref:Uncharacterized protein n=1 Tax=Trametes sanguinea TaxID=158606 RepID=A0ACC1QAI1_9APHY|nr:hypothetical protein NUW54_g165 [Trametes sanguinea]